MPFPDTIHGFMYDAAFVDKTNSIRLLNPTGGMLVPSVQSLSYFRDTKTVNDERATRPWLGAYTADTRAQVLVDGAEFADFLAHVATMPAAETEALFAILDRLFIHYDALETLTDIETALTTDAAYSIYSPGSLSLSPGTAQATAYNAGSTIIEAPNWALFKVFTTGSEGQEEIELKIWTGDAQFISNYPVTSISEVVPVLSYSALLNDPIIGGGSNAFDVADDSAELWRTKLDPQLFGKDNSGIHLQKIKFYDASLNVTLVPFGILHKGLVPNLLKIRTAIKDLLLGATGSEEQWRARAPELFIADQFYLIPQWNISTTRPDQVTYPNVAPVAKILTNTRLALPALSTDYIDANIEIIAAVYDSLFLSSVPHPLNVQEFSIMDIHPTYQSYAASEPGFANMEAHTKDFANRLNIALAVAAGKATNELYQPRVEGDDTYIPFVVGTTEYYVMTKESFLNKVGA